MGVASQFGALCCSRLSAAAVGRSWGGVASAAKPFAKQQHDFRQTYEQQPSKPSKTTWLGTLAKPRTTVTTATRRNRRNRQPRCCFCVGNCKNNRQNIKLWYKVVPDRWYTGGPWSLTVSAALGNRRDCLNRPNRQKALKYMVMRYHGNMVER